ncbi:MAG: chitobiase/beta-hexosaminidase C-terminal domain-containing protein [Patescibacteria group bacterium]|nr:chitobiase/beta-hexosaminidase C-terminal domain-containing protein [Patescibacteria group bacterium]
MNDVVAIQYALFRAAQSYSGFTPVNLVLGRDYLASKIQQEAIWQTPAANGNQGVGAIIQIPTILFPKPNSLQRQREFSIGIYEEPDSNNTAASGDFKGGTFTSAEDWGDLFLDFLWNFRLWRSSGLVPQERAVVPDARFAEAGIVGVRAICVLRQERQQPARAATPAIAVDGSRNVTLSVTDGSDIWYTTDGFSYPSPSTDGSLAGETAAVKYTAPFAVAANTTVMAAAFLDPLLPSQTADLLVT